MRCEKYLNKEIEGPPKLTDRLITDRLHNFFGKVGQKPVQK